MSAISAQADFDALLDSLRAAPRRWLVTGVAGFIGGHLAQVLLANGQQVTGLDNFATGHRHNLELIREEVGDEAWSRFRFIEGDIRDLATCADACAGIDFVLHEAALGSVPRSLADPITSNATNVSGFLNMLVAARDAKVSRFVYAASSSTYGDHPALPKVEDTIGRPLSPYAVTKYVNELYADVFARSYGLASIGLRYFNVFGPRQDPNGAYAAVIPRWIAAIFRGDTVTINGDGETSRDFCYIANVVQANLRAALATDAAALNQVYNVAVGDQTSLNTLFETLARSAVALRADCPTPKMTHADFRAGDVRHSRADIAKAARLIGYAPTHTVTRGLELTLAWFAARHCA